MKKTFLFSALLAAPTLTFAGGYGGSATLPSTGASNTPTTTSITTPVSTTDFGSSEDPANALESRTVTGTENDNYLKFNYGFIPQSYWEEITGMDSNDTNGYIELEEYLGETRREAYAESGADLNREDERQSRARNKALRLSSILGY